MKYVTRLESFSIPAVQGGLCVPRNARVVRLEKPDPEVLHWKHSSARGVEQELGLIWSSFKCDLEKLHTSVIVGGLFFFPPDLSFFLILNGVSAVGCSCFNCNCRYIW